MVILPSQVTKDGIWVSAGFEPSLAPKAGLLLDRDGVLVKEVNYLHRRQDVEIAPGAVDLLRWATAADVPVAVVTNQAGIARGIFGWDEFLAVQDEIENRLAAAGAAVDLTLACPFHPDHTQGWRASHAHWRKPGPGMLQRAASLLNLDIGRSWMVGDNESDIAAAKAAGLAGAVHVLTGHGATFREAALALAEGSFPVLAVDNLCGLPAILKAHIAE